MLPHTRPHPFPPAPAPRPAQNSAVWLAVSFGLQLIFSAFLMLGQKAASPSEIARLNGWGRQWYQPERELPLYAVGCAVTLVLCWAFNRGIAPAVRRNPALLVFCYLTGTGGFLLYALTWLVALRLREHADPLRAGIPLVLVTLVQAGVFALLYRFADAPALAPMTGLITRGQARLSAWVDRSEPETAAPRHTVSLLSSLLFDLLVALLIFAVLFLPDRDGFARYLFAAEGFHHWDFYAVAPALAFQKGLALCTDFYTQYGVGWPLTFAFLAGSKPLSYGAILQTGVFFGCVYFVGLYLLLRVLLRSRGAALAGALLAIMVEALPPFQLRDTVWHHPASSVLRSPLDVWAFLCLALHLRTGKPVWFLTGGLLVGGAVLFGTDTGFYLAFAFAVYCLLRVWDREGQESDTRLTRGLVAGAACLAGATLLAGLWVASRGTVFHAGFVRRWLEVFFLYPSGVSMIPFTSDKINLVFSAAFLGLYLNRIGRAGLKLLNRDATARDVLLLSLAVYGLCYFLYFVGRSHRLNVYPVSLPAVLLGVIGMHDALGRLTFFARPRAPRIVLIAPALVALMLVSRPVFRAYPNVFHPLQVPLAAPEQTCYFPATGDVCVPDVARNQAAVFRQVTEEVKRLSAGGKTVAIISNDDTNLYVAAEVAPWGRYSPLLPNLMSVAQVDAVRDELTRHTADYVLLPRQTPFQHPLHPVELQFDTTEPYNQTAQTVQSAYTLDHRVGPYDVWRAR